MRHLCVLPLLTITMLAQTPPSVFGVPAPRAPAKSFITIYDVAKKTRTVVYTAGFVMEAPNWSPDGKYLLLNGNGKMWRLELAGTGAKPVEIPSPTPVNNDHGISRDGKLLAMTVRSGPKAAAQVWISDSDGKNPRLVTPGYPSFYHGWSPDGKWLAFTGERNGNVDIYRVPAAGGPEERLTTEPKYDDGADYSPDGKWLYINTLRTGNFDIWRLPAQGAGPDDKLAQQVTSDAGEDWFPHPSPDGKWMVFVTFPAGTQGHPPNLPVQLRMMPLPGGKLRAAKPRTVASFLGGQGTINVNSWSPDSKKFAFVSYELLPEAK